MQTIDTRAPADGHWWSRARRAVLTRELRRLGEPAHALDIGASDGAYSRVLIAQGWDVTAVDADPAAVARCRASGVDAYEADARWLPLPSGSFDLAVAFGTFAHVDDDGLAAWEMARVLRPGGVALVSVPCDLALWSAHDLTLGRVRRYTRDALALLVADAGLVLDFVVNLNVLLRPLVRLRRHRVHGWETRSRRPSVNRLLTLTLAAERRLPLGTLPGTTLVARAHRPD
ncbi:class I SAM-dependent methyltransferase [Actinomadura atramentaria]|uniref:class I SAM-dependent methyltransferase n=1 Tax=Actinomadura atramentaria TaxID=1990 RepID=UPI0003679A7C|nr:class I SAM-dependent methyltransferase [Actinomadura atramentaria]